MESFELAILSNVAWAIVLALVALATARIFPQRPALTHALWVLVLVRLVTPPLLLVPPIVLSESFTPPADSVPNSVVESPHQVIRMTAVNAPEPVMVTAPSNLDTPHADIQRATSAPTGPTAGVSGTPAIVPVMSISAGHGEIRPDLPADASVGPATSPSGIPSPSSSAGWTWRSVLTALWFCGAAAWSGVVFLQIVRLRRLLRSAQAASGDLVERTSRVATRLGLRRVPGVWIVPTRIPPMVWSLGGPPRLLLPAELWKHLDGEQQETILAHELAHLRRRDHWVRWLEGVVLGLHWWNPLAWWARRQIEKAEEPCCDAWVVWALPESVDAYAEALVATAAFLSGARVPHPVGATGARRVNELRRRLTMILSDAAVGPIARAPRSTSQWTIVLCLLALVLLPVFAPGQSPPEETREDHPASIDHGKESPSAPASPSAPVADETIDTVIPTGTRVKDSDALRIPRGMRVVTIHTNRTTIHGGALKPGDEVDVGVTLNRDSTGQTVVETKVLLEGVKVFAMEPRPRGNSTLEEPDAETPETLSLLVAPEQVPYIQQAEAKGKIVLKLRSPLENDIAKKLVDKSLFSESNNSAEADRPMPPTANSRAAIPTGSADGVQTTYAWSGSPEALSPPPKAGPQPAAPGTSPVRSSEQGRGDSTDRNTIPGEGQPAGPEMKIQEPVIRELARTKDFVGRFEAFERVELQARASGALLKINADAGTLVRRGDLLFEIDSRLYVAELRKAEAELARLEAQLRRRALDLDRAQKLVEGNVISQEEADRVQGDIDEVKAAIGVAQPEIELARLKLEATRITAPIDGRFRPDRIRVGELVLEDKTVLGSIESVDPVAVRFAIDETTFLNMNRTARPQVEVLEFAVKYVEPSQQMAPIVKKLAGEGLPIRRFYAEESPALADQFAITRYPTVVVLVDGKEVERHTGIVTEKQLRKMLETPPRENAPSNGNSLLESGAEVLIGLSSDEGYPIHGKLESVDTRINPETGTVECRALVPNKESILLSGMFARVRMVVSPSTRVVCIPIVAVAKEVRVSNGQTYIFKFVRRVNDRNQIERRDVILGQTFSDGLVEVTSGLKAGERIAVPPEPPATAPKF